MNLAIGMNRAAVAHGAQLPYFSWLLANGLERRQYFIPVFIALFHKINFTLVLRAIRMSGLVTETLRRGAGSEIDPAERHLHSLRQQLSADDVLRGDLALGVPHGNMLRYGLTVVRVVACVAGDDASVL